MTSMQLAARNLPHLKSELMHPQLMVGAVRWAAQAAREHKPHPTILDPHVLALDKSHPCLSLALRVAFGAEGARYSRARR